MAGQHTPNAGQRQVTIAHIELSKYLCLITEFRLYMYVRYLFDMHIRHLL